MIKILKKIYIIWQKYVPFSIKRFINRTILNLYNRNIYIDCTNFFQLWDIINKKVLIWEKTFIGRWWYFFASNNLIKIWKYCSIAWNCYMITYNHPTEYITWHINRWQHIINLNQEVKRGDIIIWDDVWLWQNVIILAGVKIGNGAIIWAWAVVTKDIPPYAIAWWNPAKVIKYRFNENQIKYIEKLQWWNWDKKQIRQNQNLFNTKVSELKI